MSDQIEYINVPEAGVTRCYCRELFGVATATGEKEVRLRPAPTKARCAPAVATDEAYWDEHHAGAQPRQHLPRPPDSPRQSATSQPRPIATDARIRKEP